MFDISNPHTWAILLVDDEPDNLEVLAESLVFFGASVRTAVHGGEGLEILKDFLPDLIILDLSMPVMDGWAMRQHVRNNPATEHIPILALSAHAMTGDRERALEVGFNGYLTKPINLASLIDSIRGILQESSTESEHELQEGTEG